MSTGMRRGLAWAFVILFLISAPVVVLYTAGYRLNLPSGRLVQTGILSISSVPSGARVLVDGVLSGTTSALVKNLLPGSHRVELRKDGYLPWSKTLPIESQRTTFVQNAVLNADKPAVLQRAASAGAGAFARATGNAAYVRQGKVWNEIWSYQPQDGGDRLVARRPSSDGMPALAWSPDGTTLAISTGSGPSRSVSLVNVDDGRRFDLPAKSGTPAGWDAGTGAAYLLSAKDGISSADVDGDVVSIAPSPALALETSADGSYAIVAAEGERLAVVHRQANGVSLVGYVPMGNYRFAPAPDGWLALDDADRQSLIVLDGNGSGAAVLTANASQWQWEPKGRRLLYTDGHELHLFDPLGGGDETLTRVSDPITGIAWRVGLDAALYAQGAQLVSIEFDRRDGRETATLAQGNGFQSLWTDPSGKTAFTFGSLDGGKTSGLISRGLE